MPSSGPSGPGSSDRPAPDVGIGAVYRGRDFRVACASQSVVVLIVLVAWAIAAGPQAEALDDAGIFSGMATALAAVVGVAVATVRGPGPAGTPALACCARPTRCPRCSCLLGLFVAGGVLGWTEAPPGTGFAGRSAWAVLIVAMLVMAVALVLGSRVEVRGRANIVGLVVALLGLQGDVRSEAWLWSRARRSG